MDTLGATIGMGWDGIHSLSGFHLSRDITLAPQVTPPYVKGRPRIGFIPDMRHEDYEFGTMHT